MSITLAAVLSFLRSSAESVFAGCVVALLALVFHAHPEKAALIGALGALVILTTLRIYERRQKSDAHTKPGLTITPQVHGMKAIFNPPTIEGSNGIYELKARFWAASTSSSPTYQLKSARLERVKADKHRKDSEECEPHQYIDPRDIYLGSPAMEAIGKSPTRLLEVLPGETKDVECTFFVVANRAPINFRAAFVRANCIRPRVIFVDQLDRPYKVGQIKFDDMTNRQR